MEFFVSKIKSYEFRSFYDNHIPSGLRLPRSTLQDVYRSFRITRYLNLREEGKGCSVPSTEAPRSSD